MADQEKLDISAITECIRIAADGANKPPASEASRQLAALMLRLLQAEQQQGGAIMRPWAIPSYPDGFLERLNAPDNLLEGDTCPRCGEQLQWFDVLVHPRAEIHRRQHLACCDCHYAPRVPMREQINPGDLWTTVPTKKEDSA